MKKTVLLTCILIILFTFVSHGQIKKYSYEIVNTFPHDIDAFTQGLYYKDDIFYEGTGLNGKSSLRKINIDSGKIIKIFNLPKQYFGEGITIVDEIIYQATWKSKTIFLYDKEINLLKIDKFPYQCWGLTDNDNELIMSDGTSNLFFLDKDSYEIKSKIEVTINNKAVKNLNELEFINGKIFANIWYQDLIVIIEPEDGKITGVVDLSNIINQNDYEYELNVLNGIAYNKEKDTIYITGKLWPLIFEIELI
ncbi:MAG: glutaminyl-peptide cyclotransferase [Halanaerobiales bacterium]|nr:glutaminyl-peptide cyclotransferase [Halanaerobiales bacterium]